MDTAKSANVAILPYSEDDQWILQRTLGDSSQTVHLSGPVNEDIIRERHKKYLATSEDPKSGCMFVITLGTENTPVGPVGYWERNWEGQKVWKAGWSVLPEYQRQGIATAATILVVEFVTKLRSRARGSHRYIFAYPSVDNHQSNAICKKLGFTLIGNRDFEYPPGNVLHCNIWQLDLRGRN
jgi:RimJ/RimL family protein N-acetyltransferase